MGPGQPRPFGTPLAPLIHCVFGAPRKLWPQQPRPPLGGVGRGGPPSQPLRNAGFPPFCLFYSKKKSTQAACTSPPPQPCVSSGLKAHQELPYAPILQFPVIYGRAPRTAPAGTGAASIPSHAASSGAPTQRVRGLCHAQDGAESPSWGNYTVLPSSGTRSAAHNGLGGETVPRTNGPRCGKREARGERVGKTPLQTEKDCCHTQHGRHTAAELVLGGRDIGIERCGLVGSARRTLC